MKIIYSIIITLFGFISISNAQDSTATKISDISLPTSAKDLNAIIPSKDGKTFFTGGWDYNIYQIDALTGETIKKIEGPNATVMCLNLSQDGKLLISGQDNGSVGVWEIETGKKINLIRSHEGPVNGVCFSTDLEGKFFFSAGEDGLIKKYDRLLFGKWIATSPQGNPIQSMQIDFNGKFLYTGDANGNISIYDFMSLNKESDFNSKHTNSVFSISISPDGKWMATGSGDKSIKLWDIKEKKEVKSFQGHTWKVLSVAFNRSQEYLVSSSNDGTVKIWKIESGENVKTYTLPKRKTFASAQFDANSSHIFGVGQVDKFNPNSLYIWETGLGVGEDVKFIPEATAPVKINKPVQKKPAPKKK